MAQLQTKHYCYNKTYSFTDNLPACPAALPQPTNMPLLLVLDHVSGKQIGCAVTKIKH